VIRVGGDRADFSAGGERPDDLAGRLRIFWPRDIVGDLSFKLRFSNDRTGDPGARRPAADLAINGRIMPAADFEILLFFIGIRTPIFFLYLYLLFTARGARGAREFYDTAGGLGGFF